jgi:hypothetical protein
MRRPVLMVIGVLSLISLTGVQALTPAWTLDVGPGYITTAPVVDDEAIYLRTSGFWTGEERPRVLAVNLDGDVTWSRTNTNTTQHDMAPLVLVGPGTGPCGSWSELLLVGWADGTFEALDPNNGRVKWSVSTAVDGWGITGRAALDGDHVVVPSRNGLVRLCLANGAVDFEVELGLGWRNGVTVTEAGYWMGDEAGRLWHVSRLGEAASSATLPGSLRHPPVRVGEALLLHAQTTSGSALMRFDPVNQTLDEVAMLGPSPALPLPWSHGAVLADSQGLTSVVCHDRCEVVSNLTGHVNGEMAWASSTVFHAPVNSPTGGWMTLSLDDEGGLGLQSPLNTSYDGYGTAAPGYGPNRLYLGNDRGVLMAFDLEADAAPEGEPAPLLASTLTVLAFVGVAVLASQNRTVWAWRWFSLILVTLAVVLLPSLGTAWGSLWPVTAAQEEGNPWDPAWPDDWLGTQVVVVEFEDETVVVGGLVGHATVLEATEAAAEEHSLDLELEATPIGTYLASINGIKGSGWEYFIDGERGAFAVDEASVPPTGVLVWRLA